MTPRAVIGMLFCSAVTAVVVTVCLALSRVVAVPVDVAAVFGALLGPMVVAALS